MELSRRPEAPPPARAGERSAEEDGGRSGTRDRRAQGDHAKTMVGARVRRQQVAYARRRGLSSRRACAVLSLSVARSTLGYQFRAPAARCAGPGGHARARGPVSAVRLPEGPDLSRAPGTPDECRTDLSVVAPGGPARAASAPAAAGGYASPPAAAPDREESRVGLRLRLRVRGWPVAEVLGRSSMSSRASAWRSMWREASGPRG